MTTIAMIAGMIPVALGLEGDSSFRAPMAVTVIAGLITSTALSLLVVPVIFDVIDKFRLRKHVLKQPTVIIDAEISISASHSDLCYSLPSSKIYR